MAVEKSNIPEITEEEKVELQEGQPIINDEVDEVTVEGEEVEEPNIEDDFNANLAENIDERTLSRMATELVSDYKKDKETKEWYIR